MWTNRPFALVLLAVLFAGFLPSVPAQAPAGEWRLEDGAGDVKLTLTDAAPSPPENPVMAHVDLRGLTIEGEDELGFWLNIEVQELHVADEIDVGFEEYNIDVAFDWEETAFTYDLQISVYGGYEPDASGIFRAVDAYGSLCIDRQFGFCFGDDVEVELDDEGNRIRAHLSKTELVAHYERVQSGGGAAPVLKIGSQLSSWSVSASAEQFCLLLCPVGVRDTLPDTGVSDKAYELKHVAANTVIQVWVKGSGGPEGDQVAVQAGFNQTVPFAVLNRADGKRLIQLHYSLEGPEAKSGLYGVFGPSTVTVPASQVMNFTLSLSTAATALPADGMRLVIEGESAGHPDERIRTSFAIVPGTALGPDQNQVYFHAMAPEGDGVFDNVACTASLAPCQYGFLSVMEEHPQASSDPRISGYSFFGSTGGLEEYFYISIDLPLAGPAAFAKGGQVELDLDLRSALDVEGVRVEATLYQWGGHGDSVLFEASETTDVSSLGTLLTLTGPQRLGDNAVIPAGSGFGLQLHLLSPTPSATAAALIDGVYLQATGSVIRLPLTEVPDEYKVDAIPSPFQMGVLGQDDQFVNPGEARLFNVTILNQASETHRITLDVVADSPGWAVDVQPGKVFDLDAGDLITLTVLLRAPADATEGQSTFVHINGTADNGAVTSRRLAAQVVTIDQPDDSHSVDVDPDAKSKLVDPGAKDTPGPPVAGLLAGVGLLGALLRRRKT